MTDASRAPWLRAGFSEVASAERVGDDIEVSFGDGEIIRVSPALFGVTGDFQVTVDEEDPLSVQISVGEARRRLSWSQLRAATDPDFAQEMRRQDGEESRRLGLRLRALREDRGLSQRDLANQVGMSAPQLSKIESGTFDLRVSTVQTLLRAMGATFADIASPDALELSQKAIARRAEKMGVARDLIARILDNVARNTIPQVLGRAFGWQFSDFVAGVASTPPLGTGVRFKTTRPGDLGASPLLHVARVCSEVVDQHAQRAPFQGLPVQTRHIRAEAQDSRGQVTLSSLLSWTWDRGIAVVPMHGRGAFCAAVWFVGEAPAVVLKETRESSVFWLFDLAHELGHIAHGHIATDGIVDVDPPRPSEHPDAAGDAQEHDANEFALELLLGDHRGLVSAVRAEARGSYLRFKGAVATVARRANVSAGLLGMVAAYELIDIGEAKDRWGSATNLAEADGLGRPPVQAALARHLDLDDIGEPDRGLLRAAVMAV